MSDGRDGEWENRENQVQVGPGCHSGFHFKGVKICPLQKHASACPGGNELVRQLLAVLGGVGWAEVGAITSLYVMTRTVGKNEEKPFSSVL